MNDNNGTKGTEKSIPIPLVTELRNLYGADFKHLAMSGWQSGHILAYGEKKISKGGNFMDVEMPEMLSLEMVKGDQLSGHPRRIDEPQKSLRSE